MEMIEDLGCKKNSYGNYIHYGLYKCPTCGKDWEVSVKRVKEGRATQCKSCGMKKHGKSNYPLYYIWKNMIARCYDPKHPSYKHYGAKGVIVCNEWLDNVNAFITWAEVNGYKKGLHLDKDELSKKSKIYSPETCQFITQQDNNKMVKHKTSKSGYIGVRRIIEGGKWEARICHNSKIKILGYYNTAEEAGKVRNKYIDKHGLKNKKTRLKEK